jgi:hypothetical protein
LAAAIVEPAETGTQSTRHATMRGRKDPVRAMPSPPSNKPESIKSISLTRFLIEEQRDQRRINADLRLLIETESA